VATKADMIRTNKVNHGVGNLYVANTSTTKSDGLFVRTVFSVDEPKKLNWLQRLIGWIKKICQ